MKKRGGKEKKKIEFLSFGGHTLSSGEYTLS
jgi:hypothetical protein